MTTLKDKIAYIEVTLDYAPSENGTDFDKWCEKYGFTPLNGGRRAWCSGLSTYFRSALGIATTKNGERLLFEKDDLADMTALHAKEIEEVRKDAFNKIRSIEITPDSSDYELAQLRFKEKALLALSTPTNNV